MDSVCRGSRVGCIQTSRRRLFFTTTRPDVRATETYGRGAGVGRGRPPGLGLAVGEGLGVDVGVDVGIAVAVDVGVDVGVAVAVGVDVDVGVGVGVGVPPAGPWIAAIIGEPVLKKPTVALKLCGGLSASKRKLYNVPQRIAFAFGFCANVSVFQVMELPACVTVHGVLL